MTGKTSNRKKKEDQQEKQGCREGPYVFYWLKQNIYGSEHYQATPARPSEGDKLNTV